MIDMKTISMQEDFLKDAFLTQIRTILDRRNLKFNDSLEYDFAS